MSEKAKQLLNKLKESKKFVSECEFEIKSEVMSVINKIFGFKGNEHNPEFTIDRIEILDGDVVIDLYYEFSNMNMEEIYKIRDELKTKGFSLDRVKSKDNKLMFIIELKVDGEN
jgi:hypothetical protein